MSSGSRTCADGHDPVSWQQSDDQPAECWFCGAPGRAGGIGLWDMLAKADAIRARVLEAQ